MTFEIQEFAPVKMTNMNTRTEKHGVESVPAVDLNFSMDAMNSVLSNFDGGLLSALYHRVKTTDDAQAELEGVEPITDLPNLRFPKLAPIKWDWKGMGYTLQIDYGLGAERCIELEGLEVGKIVLDCKEGGTVEVKFQVQCCSGLTEAIIGKLAMMNGQEVHISLRAPKTLEETGAKFEPLFPDHKPDAPVTATDIFMNAAGAEPEAVH
jgi:hypothetical protein